MQVHPMQSIDPSPGAKGQHLSLPLPALLTCATIGTSLATGGHYTLLYAGLYRLVACVSSLTR